VNGSGIAKRLLPLAITSGMEYSYNQGLWEYFYDKGEEQGAF
jgi:hypothetical protein